MNLQDKAFPVRLHEEISYKFENILIQPELKLKRELMGDEGT